jgi:hypothetical protein
MSRFLRGDNVQTHNNSVANLLRGVGERVLFTNQNGKLVKPIQPVSGIFVKRLDLYRKQLISEIGRQSPVTHDQFVDYYKGPRRLIYQRAVDGLAVMPVQLRDSYLKTFVKAEKLNFNIKNDPAPRVIQPRSPRYNVEIGCYLRPLEKKLYKAIDKLFNSPVIMSPYNSFTLAAQLRTKWEKFNEPVCIGLDASRFDQHVSQEALQFEHSIYNHIYSNDRKLAWLLKMQLKNIGFAEASDGKFRYETKGSRMSGDMNTSMGNKLLMCLMSKAYLDGLKCKTEFANNGDDCLIFVDKSDLPKLKDLKAHFVSFGFNVVLEEHVTDFEKLEFCQTHPVKSNGVWRMVRNYLSCLTKDVTSVNLGHRVDEFRALLRNVGDCGSSFAEDVPVLGRFYAMLKRFGKEGKLSTQEDEFNYYKLSSRNARCPADKPDQYARYSFWLAFGLCPDAQIELEKYFDESVWGADNRQVVKSFLFPTK